MPASSKSQQRFFGVVKAMQKGDIPKKGKAGKIAKQMSKKDVDDFASTKHKGKPEKVKREMKVRNLIKKMVREELAEMNEGKYDRELIRLDNATAKEFGSWKSEVLKLSKLLPNSEKKKINKDIMTINKLVFNITKTFDKNLDEGTCGYGENGQLGEEPAGPHLIKKKKIKEKKLNEKMDAKKAKTILQQLGANRFIAMTGAKNFAFDSKYMSFKIGRNSKGINHVRIAHNAKDLYDMEFGFNSVKGYKVKKKVKDVYADMLTKIFQKYTGLRTRL